MSVLDLDRRTINDAVAELVYGAASKGYVRTYAAGRVEYSRNAREAYSYGRHFPLFRFVPPNGRRAALFVVNGDRWSNGWRGGPSRTNDHQSMARESIERTGLASILLPFSALTGAGIDIDSIRPLDVRPDRWETVTERRPTLDQVPRWRRDSVQHVDADSRFSRGGWYVWTEERHILGESLFTAVRDGRRARYLSSFDTNENPPLYFLCEVPARGVPQTVDAAIDSLAPRAVHAARLAGKDVQRQGDVFFISTSLDRETLKDRGAVFGRLTQWSRRAAPKAGEVTYTAPDREKEKRVQSRELAHARRLWRETFRGSLERATVAHVPDTERREENRRRWDEWRAENPDADYSRADAYRMRHDRRESHSCGPSSTNGQRRRWAKLRSERLARIETAKRDLRRATLTGTAPRGWGFGGKGWSESNVGYRRRLTRQAVVTARETLQHASAPVENYGATCNAHARDAYRQKYGTNALAHWTRAKDEAQRKYRPETVFDTTRAMRDRETVRKHLMIYGTSHSATEVARVGSAVYVRGTVRHAVDLETGRREGPDHRPLTLAPDVWYLAVRNTVPRQNRRRRRHGNRTVSG